MFNQNASTKSKVTLHTLQDQYQRYEKITMLTCYDASFAQILDQAGIDILLVGDSLGNVIQGKQTTVPVLLEHIVYHTQCVANAHPNALILSDLPFGTYHTPEQALAHATQLMRAGAEMIKLEGGAWLANTVHMLKERGIPVCAHLGLTPQSIHVLGGFKVQGKNAHDAAQILADAQALQAAGAAMIVLEAVPATLAQHITETLTIPTIGIGAGKHCSGQVLVLHDMLGLFPGKSPRFSKNYMMHHPNPHEAISAYIHEVKCGEFPEEKHSFK